MRKKLIAISFIINIFGISYYYFYNIKLVDESTISQNNKVSVALKKEQNLIIQAPKNKSQLMQEHTEFLEKKLSKEKQYYRVDILGEDKYLQNNDNYSNQITPPLIQNQQDSINNTKLLTTIQNKKDEFSKELLMQVHVETSPKIFLQLAKKIIALSKETLSHEISNEFLSMAIDFNETQQSEMLLSLENSLSEENLADLEEFLMSENYDVHEEAFLRLEEIGISEETVAQFQYIAENGQVEWMRNQAMEVLNTY